MFVISNWFNFYPVGQGLFYAGILANGRYSFAYDCDTETAGSSISDHIKHLKSLLSGKQLDFFVISHFHEDHISNAKELIDSIGSKELIVPYLCQDFGLRVAISLAIVSYFIAGDELTWFAENLIRSDVGQKWEVGNGLAQYSIIKDYWRFDFISKPISNAQETSFAKAYANLLQVCGYKDALSLIRQGYIKKLQSVYESVFGKGNMLNETSVVMLHQPILNDPCNCCVKATAPNPYSWPAIAYIAPTTILTGDAMVDQTMAAKINSLITTDIGMIQVPHHGSYPNWKKFKSLINNGNSIYLIPCGARNKHKHPSKRTNAELNGYKYFQVTEYSGYPYWIVVYIV